MATGRPGPAALECGMNIWGKKGEVKPKQRVDKKGERKKSKATEQPEDADPNANSTVIRLSNVPYGFFEQEMFDYFRQFGKVERVRVTRSKKGYHTGLAFVKFRYVAVAEIAGETMDNYLIAEKRMRCKVLKNKDTPNSVKHGGLFVNFDKPNDARVRHANLHFAERTPLQEARQRTRFAKQLKSRMQKIAAMGIDYTFDYETKLKQELAKSKTAEAQSESEAEEEVEEELERDVDQMED